MEGPRARLSLAVLAAWIAIISGVLAYLYIPLYSETAGHSEDLLPQWTIARLAMLGHGVKSYDYATQYDFLQSAVPPHKTIILNSPHIRHIGVSPYPPTMIVLYAPLGVLELESAAKAFFIATLILCAVSAVAIAVATSGSISPWAAAAAILLYPGCLYNVLLGQNAALTLALLAVGWCALVHRFEFSAGLVWGLLSYKPQWLVAVIWLPIFLRQWRCVFGILLSASALAGIGAFWLGPAAWDQWLAQVQAQDVVAYTNGQFRMWILGMACDLRGVINLWLPGNAWARPLGWGVLGVVGVVGLALTRRSLQRPDQPLSMDPAAPAWLATVVLIIPYLYYYDEMLLVLPLLVLWSQRSRFRFWELGLLVCITVGYYVALPVMMYRDAGWTPSQVDNGLPEWGQPRPMGWLGGPNWAALCAVSLWLLSLLAYICSKRRPSRESYAAQSL